MDRSRIVDALYGVKPDILLGIDGMIDEVWELLDSRTGANEYIKMTKLMELGDAITQRGTGGLAKERLLKRRSSGGFTCNTGRATAMLGARTTLLGMYGSGSPDPVFEEFHDLCQMISLGDPAQIHVLEFMDGKIFMPNLDALIHLRWDHLVERLGMARLLELCQVDIVGMGYWSNLYDFEAILQGVVDCCLAGGKTKRVFHDFANLNKRSPQALEEAITLLGRLSQTLPQTLSLNEHEGDILARQLQVSYPEAASGAQGEEALLQATIQLREKTGLDEIIIHTLYFAAIATATQGSALVHQDYYHNAVKTTGSGDTFNGGYMMASMTNLNPRERLMVANAATRYYVEHAVPPTCQQLLEQLERSGL